MPRKISALCSTFIRKGGTISCCVTGSRRYSSDLPQGGLEIPCIIKFVGNKKDVDRVNSLALKVLNYDTGPPPKKAKVQEDKAITQEACKVDGTTTELNQIDMTTMKEVDLQKTKGDKKITESLSVEDMEKIFVRNGLKVTDVSMKWANYLLKQKFPNLNGLQSTLIQSKEGLNHCADNKLQIIHCRSNDHWILTSTISSVEL